MPITQILLTAVGGIDFAFPAPGGGSFLTDLAGVGYANVASQGTPYDPGSGLDSVPNMGTGWIRRRIQTADVGGLYGAPGAGPFADSNNVVNTTTDYIGGFGFLNDSTQENYALEWVGYWQASQTGNYNFLMQSDDRAWFWIGNNSLSGTFFWNNAHVSSDNSTNLNTNSVSVVSGKYYPIRIWFQEFTGAEYCQLFVGPAGATPVVLTQDLMRYNTATFNH